VYPRKQLAQVGLDDGGGAGLAQNLQQVVVTQEVKPVVWVHGSVNVPNEVLMVLHQERINQQGASATVLCLVFSRVWLEFG
jgi:hypothetical protein